MNEAQLREKLAKLDKLHNLIVDMMQDDNTSDYQHKLLIDKEVSIIYQIEEIEQELAREYGYPNYNNMNNSPYG